MSWMILLGGGETPVTGSHILDIEEEIDFGIPLLNLRGSVQGRMLHACQNKF